MRCVLQRVKSASVTVDGEVISSIGRGALTLLVHRPTSSAIRSPRFTTTDGAKLMHQTYRRNPLPDWHRRRRFEARGRLARGQAARAQGVPRRPRGRGVGLEKERRRGRVRGSVRCVRALSRCRFPCSRADPPPRPLARAVSQFTLQANLRKGAKPDFHGACPPDVARQMYEDLLADLRRRYKPERIQDGRFQAMMDVQLVNDVRPPFASSTSSTQ